MISDILLGSIYLIFGLSLLFLNNKKPELRINSLVFLSSLFCLIIGSSYWFTALNIKELANITKEIALIIAIPLIFLWLKQIGLIINLSTPDQDEKIQKIIREQEDSKELIEILETTLTEKNQRLSILESDREILQEMTKDRQGVEAQALLTQFAVEHAADAIFWVDSEAKILYANQAACRSLGYSANELTQMTIHDINPKFPKTAWSLHWSVLRRCGFLSVESYHRTKHNQLFPVEITISHLEFNGEEYQCTFVRDISDRKLIDRMLRQKQHEFQLLVSSIPGAVYRCALDEHWTMDFLSEWVKVITGYPANDFIHNRHRSFASIILPEDRLKIDRENAEIKDLKQPYIHEYRVIAADGSLKWIYEKGRPILDEKGKVVWLIGVMFDITEQKENLESIQQSQERLKLALAGTGQGLWDWNLQTGEVYFSSQWTDILGYAKHEIEGKARWWLKLVHPQERHLVNDVIRRHFDGKITFFEVEHRMLSKSGEWRWLINHGKIVARTSEGKPLRMTGTVKDITDRKKAEAALRASELRERERALQLELTIKELKHTQAQLIQTEKMSSLGQMVAGIAHEINNPVSFIYGNITYADQYIRELLELIELYQEYYPEPLPVIKSRITDMDLDFIKQDLLKILQSMESGAERIGSIVNSLRNFSRLDESQMKPVDIHEGIENTLLILQSRLKSNEDHVEIEVIKNYGKLPLVECYPGQLNQVFMNLLNNSIDSLRHLSITTHHEHDEKIPEEPKIWIQTEVLEQRRLFVKIRDNGPGVPEELRDRLFDPFFTTKPVGKGTGLGLSISYRIIEKHSGVIWCNSTPGSGVEFIIEIPLHQSKSYLN